MSCFIFFLFFFLNIGGFTFFINNRNNWDRETVTWSPPCCHATTHKLYFLNSVSLNDLHNKFCSGICRAIVHEIYCYYVVQFRGKDECIEKDSKRNQYSFIYTNCLNINVWTSFSCRMQFVNVTTSIQWITSCHV